METGTEAKIQTAFHESVGAIMQYLDDSDSTSLLKRAIRDELWGLCDNKIKPILGKGSEHETTGNC